MFYFKDSNNAIHALESLDHVELLPNGCIEVTEEEVATIRAANAPIVPVTVSRAQGRMALHNAGLLAQVDAIAADPATDPMVVIAINDAQTFDRNSPTLAALAGGLGLSDADLDALFIAASEVVV